MPQPKLASRILGAAAAAACTAAVLFAASAASAGTIAGPYSKPDDHFLCYKAGLSKLDKDNSRAGSALALEDLYDTAPGTFLIAKEKGVCLPADTNDQGVVDSAIHFTSYQIKGDGKHEKQRDVRVMNQFGEHFLDTKKEALVLVPATMNPTPFSVGTAPEAPLGAAHGVDHYKCYKAGDAKGRDKFSERVVTVADGWTATKSINVKKPKLLCAPVEKDGEGVKNADGYQVCYQAKTAKGEAKHVKREYIWFTDVFGSNRYGTKKEALLCVPSLANLPEQFCGDGMANQGGAEACDGDPTPCSLDEVCTSACACSLCGNGNADIGEQCELDTDCPQPTDECVGCACQARAALGQRALSMGGASGFYSSFAPVPIGTPSGTLLLDAGAPNHQGEAPVGLAATATFAVDITLGVPSTLCYELSSCAGTVYCEGGANVDTTHTLDSLNASLTCVRDGSNACADEPGNVCCSNACEGPGVGSGNAGVIEQGSGATDSGNGALEMLCNVRVVPSLPFGTDCSGIDYSGAPSSTVALTTGVASSVVTNHCAGATAADEVPNAASPGGENFNCASWTVTDAPGRLDWAAGAEEPSALVSGDGANVIVLDD